MLFIYDYTITFPYEVRLFWRGKATGATLLFFANRYLTLFISTFNLATIVSMSNAVSSCGPSHRLTDTETLKDVGINLVNREGRANLRELQLQPRCLVRRDSIRPAMSSLDT